MTDDLPDGIAQDWCEERGLGRPAPEIARMIFGAAPDPLASPPRWAILAKIVTAPHVRAPGDDPCPTTPRRS